MPSFNPHAFTQGPRLPSRLEPTGSVLVSIDGTRAGQHALEWATAEASARGGALSIVRPVASPSVAAGQWLLASQPGFAEMAYSVGREDLAAAREQAHAIDPQLAVSTDLLPGALGPALLRSRTTDALVVVGRPRGMGQVWAPELSAAWGVLNRGQGSIALVDLTDVCHAGPSTGRVVLALDAARHPSTVIAAAFRAALRRCARITFLHVWGDGAVSQAMEEALATCRTVFPDVEVRTRAVRSLTRAVMDESHGAALTVVAAPESARDVVGRARALRLVRAARGPVTVVSPARPQKGVG